MFVMPRNASPARSRKRLLPALALLSVAAVALVGCAPAVGAAPAAPEPTTPAAGISVVDQRGETIELPGTVERVAFTVMPAPSIFAAVDRSYDRIVGINESTLKANQGGMFATMFPASAESTTVAGADFVPNVETLIGLDPDVVIQWGDRGDDVIAPITAAGIPVVGLSYGTQEDLEAWLTLFAEIAGKPERGTALVEWQHERIEAVRAEVAAQDTPRPRAMMLSHAADSYSTTTGDGYDGFQFDLVGADLVSQDFVSDGGQVGPEQILEWNPEVIFLSAFDESTPEQILADPRLASVQAVQDGRVYKTPLGGYRWQVPGSESPLMWEWMFHLLYPEAGDSELRAQTVAAFDDLFAYPLSEDELDGVLRFADNAAGADYDQFRR